MLKSSQLENEHFKGQCLTVQGDTNVVLGKTNFHENDEFKFSFDLARCDQKNVNQKWTFNQEVELFD